MIGIADYGHEKVRHQIVVADLVKAFALDLCEAPLDRSFSSSQAGITQKNSIGCHISKHFRDVRFGLSISTVSAYIRLDGCLGKVNHFVHGIKRIRSCREVVPENVHCKKVPDAVRM